ncbi:MAG: hypothetical protein ACM34M_13385, partial [Ignavibacteria bacterium]
ESIQTIRALSFPGLPKILYFILMPSENIFYVDVDQKVIFYLKNGTLITQIKRIFTDLLIENYFLVSLFN